MNVVIMAREHSERYERKHLHPINGVPMLWSIIKRLQNKLSARVILATGPREENKSYCILAGHAMAEVYCEEEAPEWDLCARMINMSRDRGIDGWVDYSGDCPFVDVRAVQLAWDSLEGYDRTALSKPIASGAVGMGDRQTNASTRRFWEIMAENIPEGDRRREQPWVHVDESKYRTHKVPVPFTDLAKTPVKTSIDWPFEGAIADFIVRYLGRWPETDRDIEKVYSEVNVIEEAVNNTPLGLTIKDTAEGRRFYSEGV